VIHENFHEILHTFEKSLFSNRRSKKLENSIVAKQLKAKSISMFYKFFTKFFARITYYF